MSWSLVFWLGVLLVFFLDLGRRIRKLPKERRTKVALREISFIGLFYVFTMVLLMCIEKQFIFYPTSSSSHWQPPMGFKAVDIWLAVSIHGQQEKIHSWWCPVEQPRGVLLYFHGNAGNLSHRSAAIADWQRHGFSVMIVDYPGYGRSTGSPDEKGCYAAGQAAYDWLVKEQGIEPSQIVLYGKSLGAAIAVELAGKNPHQALVLFAAFTSIPDMAQKTLPFFPSRYIVRTRFDNLSKIKEYTGRLIIAHGESDKLIPPEMGKILFDAAKTQTKWWYPIADAEHFGPPSFFYTEVTKQLMRWQQAGAVAEEKGN